MKDSRKLCNEERPNVYSLCLLQTDVYSGKAIALRSGGGRFESRPVHRLSSLWTLIVSPHLVRPCEYPHNY